MDSARKWFAISCFMAGLTLATATNVAVKEFWPDPAKLDASAATPHKAAPAPPARTAMPAAADDGKVRPPPPTTPSPAPPPLRVAEAPQKSTPTTTDAGLAARVQGADFTAGKRQFKKCVACHTIAKGGKKKLGPNLWSIVGRDVASVAGYKYSKAMKSVGGTWTLDLLDRYLKSPRTTIKRTRMSFAGIKDDRDRAALLAFLLDHSEQPTGATAATSSSAAQPAAAAATPPASAADDAKRRRLTKLRERGRKFVLKDLKLPPGSGRDETEAYCGACHSMRLVVQQGQTRDGWEELLEYMVEEHAMEPLPPEDHTLVVDYLAQHYGIKRKKVKP